MSVSYNYRECAQGVIAMFEDSREWIGVRLQVVEHCARTGPAIDNPAKLEEAYELGEAMAGRLTGQARRDTGDAAG